jgi:UDP-N-acetylmuramate dehydrogenase
VHVEPRPPGLRENVPLSELTTLELGGPARYLLEARSRAALRQALLWAGGERLPVAVVGGGSNLVVSDSGFPGLVIRVALRGLLLQGGSGRVLLSAAAGERWDWVVGRAVTENLAGLECLSGIPGAVGATPVQNVGAYGQEVADTIAEVRALDRVTLREVTLTPADCGFAYRRSRFRSESERFVILAVTFRLQPGGAPTLRYAELERAVGQGTTPPTLAAVRDAVLELRRQKAMVLDPDDPNRRSVGSFFLNPVLAVQEAEEVARRAAVSGELPRYPTGDGRVKLSAAWLIEKAGFAKGYRRGAVGLSSRHVLALVHHGGGSTAELLDLAREIRAGVEARFGVVLEPEPLFLGFGGQPSAASGQLPPPDAPETRSAGELTAEALA